MLPDFDFVSNVRRFLQGNWLNASLAIKYWASTKPTAAEIATLKPELDAALCALSPDALLVKGILLYYRLESSRERREEALSCFRRAAESNRAFAYQMLGLLYEQGDINKLDYTKVAASYERALNSANATTSERAIAANNLGRLYVCGFGVLRNDELAKHYYAKASVWGEANALTNLGLLYEYGAAVAQDYSLAKKYYELAAQFGDASALDRLGRFYEQGLGVIQDYSKAVKYYGEAAKLGNVGALNHLGFFYENGFGVKKEFTQAEDRYEKAVSLGDPHAAARLTELYDNVSVWYGSFSVVALDRFAKNTLRQREINYLSAKILGGNFDDLCSEIQRFLADNASSAVIRIFTQLARIVDYLLQRREQDDGLDYQVRISDFWNLTGHNLQSKYEFEKYLKQHPFTKKFFHSNHYFNLRGELGKLLTQITDDDFFNAAQLYRQYLKFRREHVVTSLEREVVRKLCDTQMRPYPLRLLMPVPIGAECCFFSDSADSSPKESPKEAIELKQVV